MDVLTKVKIMSLLKRNLNYIMIFTLMGFLVGIVYSLIIFKPTYQSTATILVKNLSENTFTENTGKFSHKIMQETQTIPVLTQMQILQSENNAKKVWANISQKYNLEGNEKEGTKFIEKAISIKNPEKTDIIKITAKWTEPEIARDIAQEFADAFIALNTDILKQEALKNKFSIDKQLEEAEQNLQNEKNKADKSNWTNIINNLKSEQIMANLNILGITQNVSLIDSPSLALHCIFPDRTQVATIFTIFSFLFSIIVIITMSLIKITFNDVEQLEKAFDSPILGIIPWVNQDKYDESDGLFSSDEISSPCSFAYQKIISGLRIKGCNSNINALGFTSSEFSKTRSSVIINTAYNLNKTGQSVVIVDADFRTPSISQEFHLRINEKYNLTELLSAISQEKKLTGYFNWNKLSIFAQEVPNTKSFCIIPNTGNVPDPCKFLHSEDFKELIQELKKKFDWVFVDTPPAPVVPDALTISRSVDGMVLVTGLNSNRYILKKISKQFKNYGIQIFGIIARETETNETESTNKYISQMVAKMMPPNKDLLMEE